MRSVPLLMALLSGCSACGTEPPSAPAAVAEPRACVLDAELSAGSEDAAADALAMQLLRELAAASERPEPPRADALWPATCAALYRESDPALAEAALRVMERGGAPGARLAVTDAAIARVRALAPRLQALSVSAPGDGPALRAPDALGPAAVLEDARCETRAPPPPPPFLEPVTRDGARVHDELLGYESWQRIVERGGGLAWITSEGETQAIRRDGLSHPRFADDLSSSFEDTSFLWLVSGGRATRRSSGERLRDPEALPLDEPAQVFARCGAYDRYSGGFQWLAVRHGRAVSVFEHPSAGAAAMRVHPAPPSSGVLFRCSNALALLLWREGGRWTGSYCRGGACRQLPDLLAPDDLRVAVAHEVVLVTYGGRRTDLSVMRSLEADLGLRWGEARPALRGALDMHDRMFVMHPACASLFQQPVMSTDAVRWRPYFDP